jgi:hypothetical protein
MFDGILCIDGTLYTEDGEPLKIPTQCATCSGPLPQGRWIWCHVCLPDTKGKEPENGKLA